MLEQYGWIHLLYTLYSKKADQIKKHIARKLLICRTILNKNKKNKLCLPIYGLLIGVQNIIMSKRIITYLLLLPLALLTTLPCSIKQDIKLLLGIAVNTSFQVEKSRISNTTCAYTYNTKKKSEKQQQFNSKKILYHFFSQPIVLADTSLYQKEKPNQEISSSPPIFLVYRKLII